MMRMRAARRRPIFGTAQLVLLLAAGCSLQNFDYLQQASGGAGGTDSSSAGKATAGSDGEGGEAAGSSSGGTNGGTAPSGGTKSGGSSSGGSAPGGSNTGGKGGSGGKPPTGELENGSFETGSLTGWTVDPPNATAVPTRYAFVQPPQGSGTVPDGGYEFSTWHMEDAFAVELHQTIEGLEDGYYIFKGYFNLGTGHNSVEMFVEDCGGTDPDPVPILAGGAADWLPITITAIEVKGGSCTVGVRIDSNKTNWLNADLFTFEPDPNPPGGEGGAAGAGGAN